MGDNDQSWQSYVPTEEDEEDISREDLRDLLAYFGFDLPASMEDITTVATQLQQSLSQLEYLRETGEAVHPLLQPVFGAMYLQTQEKAKQLTAKLYSYASEKFGAPGAAAVQSVVSTTLRPATPSVATLPTAEEFLEDYDQAFSTYVEGLQASGALSKKEAEFAYDTLRSDFFQKYTAKLGEFATAGQSPFTMKEISREERGIGAGTEAGKALEAALGAGVKEPTTLTGTSGEVSVQAEKIGTGIAREFTTVPRVMPLNFLQEVLSPASIKTAYAGSLEGAGRGARVAPPGYTSTPRRV